MSTSTDNVLADILEPQEGKEKQGKAWPKRLALALLACVLVIAIVIGGGALYARTQLSEMQSLDFDSADIEQLSQSDEVKQAGEDEADAQDLEDAKELLDEAEAEWAKSEDVAAGRPVNFLIVGSDSRISAGNPDMWEEDAQRSDVLMIAQISADRKHVAVMSVPRDLGVVIPGHEEEGPTKLNHAYMYGGLPLTMQTLNALTGIHIDHVMTADFTSFVGLTDVVGGVTLTSQRDGTRTYNGSGALSFVRTRKGLPLSDLDRVRRQQAWMRAVMAKLLTRDVMASPSKLKATYDSIKPYVAVDSGLSLTEVAGLANSLRDADMGSTAFVTFPTDGYVYNKDGRQIFNINYGKSVPLMYAFQAGRAWDYIQTHSLDTLDSRPVE